MLEIVMEYEKISFKSLGTNIEIKIFDKNAKGLLLECKDLVEDYHRKIVDFYKTFDEIRAKKPDESFSLRLSDDLFYMVDQAQKANQVLDNKLNILLGPLIDLWDINSKRKIIPNIEDIQEALDLSNPSKMSLDKEKKIISFSSGKMKIDLGALAKGFITDKLVDFLKENKVQSALLNLGGNIYCLGFNFLTPDLYWHIGIQAPFEKRGENLFTIKANDLSFVTSGIYERYFEYEGKIYHHILNPKTGLPIESPMESLTIISKSSLDGEIFSSSLFGQDFEYIKNLAKVNNFIALAIYKDGIIKSSKDLSRYMSGGEK